jgi:hypothetical protein
MIIALSKVAGMKRLIEFPLEDGSSVVVETDESETRGDVLRGGRPGEMIEKAGQTLEAAVGKICPAAAAIIAQLRDLTDPPNEVEMEFGLKLTAGSGVIIALAGTEANFRVTLTWKGEG